MNIKKRNYFKRAFEKRQLTADEKDFDGRRSSLESPLFARHLVLFLGWRYQLIQLQSSIAEDCLSLKRDEMIAIVGRAYCTQFLKSRPQQPRQKKVHVKDLERRVLIYDTNALTG
jgi:hypothetical protein